jgi:2-oxoisovalerate dehydrogenase E1 component
MIFKRKKLTDNQLLHLYKALIRPRIIEERMLVLLRQGRIGKWFSGIGQEAISVGVTEALKLDEYILPLHRNLGVFTSRNISDQKLFAQWQGKKSGFTKGRDRSFHFGTREHHIVGMISHLGAMLGVANGIALADLLDKKSSVTLVFSGDGGASEGDFHEALNVAAVWQLPVIFLVENNGYGLSTPSNEQFRCAQFIDKGIGYGMEALQIDGNNILDVYHSISEIAESMRSNPRPILLEAITFRMRGHEEASGVKYVPKELFEIWGQKDPVSNYEQYLIQQGILNELLIAKIRKEILETLNEGIETVFLEPEVEPDLTEEINDVFAPFSNTPTPVSNPEFPSPENQVTLIESDSALSNTPNHTFNPESSSPENSKEIRLIDAVNQALEIALEKHPNLVLMGQDIAEYGGAFKATEGLVQKFGKERVRNTPITESSILGAALGLAIKDKKAMVEMQFSDFVTCGFNQIVNNLAKNYYRWGVAADVVVRMPTGAGVQAGPFHSQSTEAWFYHVPGLKIYYPSNAADAKGLLLKAFEDPNPVLFFEHKVIYRNYQCSVPNGYYTLEEGKAAVHDYGDEAVIVTYGWAVHKALEYIQAEKISATVVDLRTLMPWDKETVLEQVKRCNKVLVLTEDTLTGSIASDIAAWIQEHAFQHLDAPVMRVGGLDTPIPLSKTLEDQFLPWNRMKEGLENLLKY